MSKVADNKRWAIVPPPSEESTELGGPLSLEGSSGRRAPARQFQVEPASPRPLSTGFSFVRTIQESDPITEVPPCSDEQWSVAEAPFHDQAADTIPAPQWLGDED